MARRTTNLTLLTNQDLMLLRKGAKSTLGITLRIGGKKFELPVEALSLTSDERGLFTFISLPAINAIVGATSTGVELIREDEKQAALRALRGTISRAKRGAVTKGARKAPVEVDPAVQRALDQVAAWNKSNGARILQEASGDFKVRRTRVNNRATP